MIIDATDLLLGRMSSFVAKKALLGEKVVVVNCEKAVISGSKANIIANYKNKRDRRTIRKGPFYPRMPDRLVKRTIRGMLPHRQYKGRTALKRIMCYIGVPEEFKKEKIETIKEAHVSKLPVLKYIKLEDLCREIGARI